jgi:hypothetical protein
LKSASSSAGLLCTNLEDDDDDKDVASFTVVEISVDNELLLFMNICILLELIEDGVQLVLRDADAGVLDGHGHHLAAVGGARLDADLAFVRELRRVACRGAARPITCPPFKARTP